MLITRPQAQSERFAQTCQRVFGPQMQIVISPVLKIVPRRTKIDLTGLTGLIFTSENGVRAFAALSHDRSLPAYCVGPRTADVARQIGFRATQGTGGAEALANQIAAAPTHGPLLHVHGVTVAGDIKGVLTQRGIPVRTQVIYDQLEYPLSKAAHDLLSEPAPVLLPVFSPRTATLLLPALVPARALLQIAAISPAVAVSLQKLHTARIDVAAQPDGASMLTSLIGLRDGASRLER
ncbi:hypothetical protein BV911_11415 [Pseudoruegeria sp. SK021]|nr:hypothetical protein BV911_11415 [Pseudoruegeria sp. SK021]